MVVAYTVVVYAKDNKPNNLLFGGGAYGGQQFGGVGGLGNLASAFGSLTGGLNGLGGNGLGAIGGGLNGAGASLGVGGGLGVGGLGVGGGYGIGGVWVV